MATWDLTLSLSVTYQQKRDKIVMEMESGTNISHIL